MKKKFKELFEKYGTTAVVVYFALFFLVLAGFAAAIAFGVKVESAAGSAGVLGGAYLATKLTQPLRIAATFAITPLVAKLVDKLRGRTSRPTGPSSPSEPPSLPPSPPPAIP